MKFLYYPGCSLKSSGRSFEESLISVLKKLNVTLEEINDWNCCGATNYMSINENNAIGLAARNLALAEKQGSEDLLAPCAACYMGLLKSKKIIESQPDIRKNIVENLKKGGLTYQGKNNVRHPLDIFVNEIGIKTIQEKVSKPLKDIKVACYYGCQLTRPYTTFDDQRNPQSMEQIVKALGAQPIEWPIKMRCCSGSMTNTVSEIGFRMTFLILNEAKLRGADVIITACPLCQFNLECFQDKLSSMFKQNVSIPVVYFTQLIGVALGLNKKELGLQRMLTPELHIS